MRIEAGLKISQINELPKGDFLVISDSVQDVIILQSESKMKAALGKNVKVSLPNTFQINKVQTKSLSIKGVPTNIMDTEFLEFLDLNKISYDKVERLKSKKDGKILPIIRPEISYPTEAETLLSRNLVYQVTSIVYKVEELRTPVLVMQCFNCQCFGHSAKNCRSKQKCLICWESHPHKRCPNREVRKPKCANCKGSHVVSYKGCPEYKKHAFRQHMVNNQKSSATALGQNSLPQPKTNQIFSFTAEQLTKFIANVVIQIAQPQVCYPNPKQDMIDVLDLACAEKFLMPPKQF